MEWLAYAAIGAVAGFFAGLLGLGGGGVVGPLLIVVFASLLRFDPAVATSMAVATAIAVIAVTSPVSALTHARNGAVDFRLAAPLAAGAMAGALLGVPVALAAPPPLLQFSLALFLLYNAARLLSSRPRPPSSSAAAAAAPPNLPEKIAFSPPLFVVVGAGIGALSAALGLGGGVITVPFLCARGAPLKKAIGVSAFVGFPLAVVAVAGYILQGKGAESLPPGAWGFVYPPAFVGVGLFGVVAARIGANATAILPIPVLRRVFSVLLVAVSARLLWLALPF